MVHVSRLEISALTSEDKPRPGQPKKFDDKELEDSKKSQMQEELAESLEVTVSV